MESKHTYICNFWSKRSLNQNKSGCSCSGALEERIWCKVRPSVGINIWRHTGFCSDPEPLTDYFLRFWDQEVDLSSLLFINLAAAAMCGGDLHCRVLIYCNVDSLLELEGKLTLLHEHNITERRGERRRGRTGVCGECCLQ